MTELLVAMIISSVVSSIVYLSYLDYLDRTAARRSAEIFAGDLSLARSQAVRSRAPVTILFSESEFTWVMRAETGDTLVTRYWDGQDESELEVMNLDLDGDSLRFNSRGVSDISSSRTSLATATFTAGESEYEVNFNGMGAYRIDAK